MATDDNEQNPFTRPGFIAAAVVVALVVVLGIVIAIVSATRSDDPDPAPEPSTSSPTTSAAPTSEPSDVAGGASVCGLVEGQELTGTLSTAPNAEWAYQGTTAYPTSSEFGPGETTAGGVRYCFQHSPTGALFMAANAITQGSDPSISAEWVEYVYAPGPHREHLLSAGAAQETEGTRASIAGFRLLSYDGESARVDLAVRASTGGDTATLSAVYDLVWIDGDWKVSTDTAQPLDIAAVPDIAGYVAWGE
ncbi:hypothetical protein ACIOWF_20240 [Cellulosimicrobium cellulans]|jgi:hypothetical protein|uniref:hypothetical protein n=1 Tax=Cellulosimicrobium cellulans TaxID=1710 RepID=UPI0037F2F181